MPAQNVIIIMWSSYDDDHQNDHDYGHQNELIGLEIENIIPMTDNGVRKLITMGKMIIKETTVKMKYLIQLWTDKGQK